MGKRLYVGNLSYSTTEQGLRDAFGNCGAKVLTVTLITDRVTGQPRGFAFVEVEGQEDAEKAIAALDGQNLDGRKLVVNEARERTAAGGGGGGFRSGGGERGSGDRGGGWGGRGPGGGGGGGWGGRDGGGGWGGGPEGGGGGGGRDGGDRGDRGDRGGRGRW